jgi:hypothetical protein
MQETKEIRALIQLLDDDDDIVYDSVKAKLLEYGDAVIPNLEHALENTLDSALQLRIEAIIAHVNFVNITKGVERWCGSQEHNILDALLILCRYRFKDIDEIRLRRKVKNIRQDIWIELNQYLTPLEQVNVISSVLYSHYRFTYEDPSPASSACCFLNTLLESNIGSMHLLGLVLLDLCHSLDLPFYAVNMPNLFLIAYVDKRHVFFGGEESRESDILFYLDPSSGSIFSQSDVEAYLKKNDYDLDPIYYKLLSNKQVVKAYIKQLVSVYSTGEIINTKEKELLHLIDIIKNS